MMKTYIMLIMLFQMDPHGYPFTSTLQESPMRQFDTQKDCESAADIKRESMLKSSLKYPDLGIVDVAIRCVDSSEAEFDPSIIHI
jgi:hypothetical protein